MPGDLRGAECPWLPTFSSRFLLAPGHRSAQAERGRGFLVLGAGEEALIKVVLFGGNKDSLAWGICSWSPEIPGWTAYCSMASLGFGQSPWEMSHSVEWIALGTPGLAEPECEGATLLPLRSGFPSSKSADGEENRAL